MSRPLAWAVVILGLLACPVARGDPRGHSTLSVRESRATFAACGYNSSGQLGDGT